MAGPGAGGGGAGLRRFRRLADLTALVTFLLIIVGGIVRVSDSGLGCGPGGSGTKGWPLCGGDVIPLLGLLLWLSFKARSVAAAEANEPVRQPVRGLKPYAATAGVLLLCAIVAGGYMAGTEERGVNEVGPNIAGAHLACGHQFPTCGDGKFLPFGNNRLTDIHLTHRVFVYAATIAIIVLLSVAYARGSRDRLLALAALLLLCQLLL